MNIWIGTMVTIMSVCAVFVTITPLLQNKRINDLENRIKELEKDTANIRNQREYLDIIVRNAILESQKESKHTKNK